MPARFFRASTGTGDSQRRAPGTIWRAQRYNTGLNLLARDYSTKLLELGCDRFLRAIGALSLSSRLCMTTGMSFAPGRGRVRETRTCRPIKNAAGLRQLISIAHLGTVHWMRSYIRTSSMILPMCALDSIKRCASAASASGNTR